MYVVDGGYGRAQNRYRYSEEDVADDDRYCAPLDPCDPYAHVGASHSRYDVGVRSLSDTRVHGIVKQLRIFALSGHLRIIEGYGVVPQARMLQVGVIASRR